MIVLDDFLQTDLLRALRQGLLADDFPWERSAILSPQLAAGLEAVHNRQLVHGFWFDKPGLRHRSPQWPLVLPLVERLRPLELVKVKANLTPRQDRHIAYGLHVDTRRPGATTAVFYLNTNNGYTLFEDGTRVESVENRLVLFDAALRHTGVSCTDEYRLVLNVNLLRCPDTPLG